MSELPVYLDYQSTTPIDPRVAEVISESYEKFFGNPHGRQHYYSRIAAEAIEDAREKIAYLIGAFPNRIVFTSGATESCNLALRGIVQNSNGKRKRIISVATEHSAVLENLNAIERLEFEVKFVKVDRDGIIDLEHLNNLINENTLIVSVMAVNNEIGVVQPINKIADMCHSKGALFHTDATQAPGRIIIDVEVWNADLLTISAHKLYGPKGIGILYVSEDSLLAPIFYGGGQERGLRSGTLPTPLICGFGEAAAIVSEEGRKDAKRMNELSKKLWIGLESLAPDIVKFGSLTHRAPGSLNFGFPGIPGDRLVAMVENEIAISTGSSCASESNSISHVLSALGLPRSSISTAIRVSLGRFTTESEINKALLAFKTILAK
ncbi:MAG: cysteine desulfurase family protein [Rhodobacteraceae bacterium]|nr:cysteine desulfurase family protein [Paracoccaceae bacterium]